MVVTEQKSLKDLKNNFHFIYLKFSAKHLRLKFLFVKNRWRPKSEETYNSINKTQQKLMTTTMN